MIHSNQEEERPKSMISQNHLPEINKIIPYAANFLDPTPRQTKKKKVIGSKISVHELERCQVCIKWIPISLEVSSKEMKRKKIYCPQKVIFAL